MAAAAVADAEGARAETARDETLVDRVLQGEREAFDVLYERYFPRVHSFVSRRISNRADAEETVQEVFINLFSSLAGYRGEACFAAWVFGVARRTIASRFKRRRHETVPLGEEEPADADSAGALSTRSTDPHEEYEATERLRRLEEAAFTVLSREQWKLFQLHHLEDHSIQEIARTTARSEDSIKSHLYRARKLLLAR